MRFVTAVNGEPSYMYRDKTLMMNGSNHLVVDENSTDLDGSAVYFKPANLWADGRGIQMSGSTISALRTAFQIQKLYEKDARGGTRYVEMLKAHFGVDAQDYRLQRPEFLGKISSFVGIHQVAQTSSTDDTSPQGNVAAFAYGSGSGSFFKKALSNMDILLFLLVQGSARLISKASINYILERTALTFIILPWRISLSNLFIRKKFLPMWIQ